MDRRKAGGTLAGNNPTYWNLPGPGEGTVVLAHVAGNLGKKIIFMQAKAVLLRARRLYDAGNLEGAAQECRRLLKSEPRETEALYLLGAIAHQTGNQPVAAECMRRALAVAPEHADWWNIPCTRPRAFRPTIT